MCNFVVMYKIFLLFQIWDNKQFISLKLKHILKNLTQIMKHSIHNIHGAQKTY